MMKGSFESLSVSLFEEEQTDLLIELELCGNICRNSASALSISVEQTVK